MIPSLLYPLPGKDREESSEDIFHSTLSTLFPGDTAVSHGDPGSAVVYRSSKFGEIILHLTNPKGSEGDLFAHCVWNAGIILCELIGGLEPQDPGETGISAPQSTTTNELEHTDNAEVDLLWKKDWRAALNGKKILEMGAGSAVISIIANRAGAGEIVCTDYPSQDLLNVIRGNLVRNLVQHLADEQFHGPTDAQDLHPFPPNLKVQVCGHQWGDLTDTVSISGKGNFDIVISADTLWIGAQHENLLASFEHFLDAENSDAEGWIIAGFHTGRARVAAFVDLVGVEGGSIYKGGLKVDKIGEIDINGITRDWITERPGESITDRKRWSVVILLKRR